MKRFGGIGTVAALGFAVGTLWAGVAMARADSGPPLQVTQYGGAWRTPHQAGMGDLNIQNISAGTDVLIWVEDAAGTLVAEDHLDPVPCEAPDCTDGPEWDMVTQPGSYTIRFAPLNGSPIVVRQFTISADGWTEFDLGQ